jgi:hypothetical protein
VFEQHELHLVHVVGQRKTIQLEHLESPGHLSFLSKADNRRPFGVTS